MYFTVISLEKIHFHMLFICFSQAGFVHVNFCSIVFLMIQMEIISWHLFAVCNPQIIFIKKNITTYYKFTQL